MKTFFSGLATIPKGPKEQQLIWLILLHVTLGILIFEVPFLSRIYALSIIIFGVLFVVKNKNKQHEVLVTAAYIVGGEVFLRATGGSPNYEFAKYSLLVLAVLGMWYSGISKKTYPYWIFLGLLIPSILLAIISKDVDIKQNIIFDISGPICLGVCALYTYKKKISINQIDTVLLALGLPIISFCSYLFLKCPIVNIAAYITSTESNFALSGNYAPNQIATVLGLGMLVFFLRSIMIPSTKKMMFLNIILFSYIYYRALLTFSRGGTITGLILIAALLFSLFLNSKYYHQLSQKMVLFVGATVALFCITSYQTDGLLLKRYTDKNPSGLPKSYEKNGRKDLALEEIKLFKENPVMGVGVGEVKEVRKSEFGKIICSHSEFTRMLAEHGSFGMLSILILFISPILLFIENRRNIYFLSFFAFWFLTINHSGMRIAAPAFLYALSLLNIQFDTANPEHEETLKKTTET